MSGNLNGQQQYVPWSVYLQDRREQSEQTRRIETKVDNLTEKVNLIAIELAKDDAAEIATEAATEGIERSRRSRSERLWEFVKTTWAAASVAAFGLIVWWLQGGNS